MNKIKGMVFFSLFLFFLVGSETYSQDMVGEIFIQGKGRADHDVHDVNDGKANKQNTEYGVDAEQNQHYPAGSEIYSPYPSNFMIPKGVCEKSEPVMIIDKDKK